MTRANVTSPARKQRNLLRPAAWAQMKSEYEEGQHVSLLAISYDVSTQTIYNHAKAGDWTRRLPDRQPPVRTADAPSPGVESFDQLVDSAISQIISVYNAEGHDKASKLAKSTEVFLRLRRRGLDSTHSPARVANETPAFKPARDLLALLSGRLGLTQGAGQ